MPILARIVLRCGDRKYWAQWAESVAGIASAHRTRINALIEGADPALAERFDAFVTALQHNLNDAISREDAAALLSQHLITKPVFDALFGGSEFTTRNPVSQVMQRMIGELEGHGLEAETQGLEDFYASVRRRVDGIDSAEGRQRVAAELYDRFFRVAFPRDAKRLGIVYTPVEIVDFIIRSVAELLREHFGASLGDEGVHILDPFTGTGTFIVRLLQSGLIDTDELPRKYSRELHANEIMLLAYNIAAVNIENAYSDLLAVQKRETEYEPFGGIVLTDTFQSSEAGDRRDTAMFPRNNARIERQLDLDIRVIIGNPPWSRMQSSHEDDNRNLPYPTLDARIAESYVAGSDSKGLKNPLYDDYVRAIRWASDRVQAGDGGIVGIVTNGGFLDSKSFDGFRKTVTAEFHEVYVFNLRGNQRTSGETSQREGGKVFGSGSRAGVAILLLVKRPGPVTEPATIRYHDIGDNLSRDGKLARIDQAALDAIPWQTIMPNAHGDWINQRNPAYLALRPVTLIQSEPPVPDAPVPLFGLSSLGLITSRDAWVFNASGPKLRELGDRQVAFYNAQVEALQRGAAAPDRDPRHFKWDGSAEGRARRGVLAEAPSGIWHAVYRPFFRQNFYMDRVLNNSVYQLPLIFPEPDTRNPAILVERGLAESGGSPAVLAVDVVPDNKANAGASGRACQVLPRYTYDLPQEGPAQASLLPSEPGRRDNITASALAAYRARYGGDVTADHVFAYVYGLLHSPEYRERYAVDLAKLLPRIPEVATAQVFHAFASAGQRLLELHIGYEDAAPYPLDEQVRPAAPDTPGRYRVTKMRWDGPARDPDRSCIVVNDWITLAGIPDEAHDYVVGPRSALAWLLDRYQVKTAKDSGIVNDVNQWGEEQGQPRYILDLVKRIVTVSVETMAIVRALPELREAEQ